MNRSYRTVTIVAIAVALAALSACGGDKKTKIAAEEAREGRDRALLADGIKELQENRYTRARLLFNTLINTYPDSSLLPVTKLALADSYYREGSFSSMNESEVEYKDWLQFFPKHELADDVLMKIAEVHMRQVQASDRDTSHAELAEKQLVKLLQNYPDTDLRQRAENQLWEIREILGMHELKVARFYYTHRQAYKAAAERTKLVVEKYPDFSKMDEALFIRGVSLLEQEDADLAIEAFTRLCRFYPQSPFYDDAVAYLKRLDAEVPEPAPDEERPKPRGETPSLVGRIIQNISHPRLDYISKDGVLFKKGEPVPDALERALKFSTEPEGSK